VCAEDVVAMARLCRAEGATRVDVAASVAEAQKLMEVRRVALSALACRSPPLVLEVATVPRSRQPVMVRFIQEVTARYDLEICTFGHAGDGNLHPTCMADERNK